MRTAGTALVLGLMLAGVAWVGGVDPGPAARRPMCDSPEVEETAFVALDYINNLHRHGYKYALERIEDAKVIPAPIGGEVYLLELDLLQTTCHVLDPTPLANCTVRDKIKMTIEGDCDVAVSKVNGVLAVKAFKCKSKPESREQMCVGCPVLLPLNHTDGLQMVDRSLAMFNKQSNLTTTFALLEVARLTSQVVGGGAKMDAEFVLVEKDCTAAGGCVPLQGPEARLAVCEATSVGQPSALTVKCKIFQAPAPVAPATNDTVGGVLPSPPVAPAPLPGNMHHKLIHLHLSDPSATGLLSESKESVEVPAVVKREAPAPAPDTAPDPEGPPPLPMGPGIQLCPGRRRLF